MTGPARIVVVGGGLAATKVVEELRALGATGRVTVLAAEEHVPYDRPPLSKAVLRGELDATTLQVRWDELDVDLRLGTRAVSVLPDRSAVLLSDGEEVPYDALVVATGAVPRKLPGLSGRGVHVLRTLDDALALRADIAAGGHVTVVGGGFIGCEVASSARTLGSEVTLVEILSAPLARVLGDRVSGELTALHRDAGVTLRCGVAVVEAREGDAGRELLLSDGSTVPADVVIVGLGVLPDTDWLAESGVEVEDGVLCDAHGRTSVAGIWAAGDVARWERPATGERQRVEHWTSAAEQGAAVARDLLGKGEPLDEVPYFWSDQFGIKLQVLGRPHADDDVTLLRVGKDGDRLLAVYGREGRFTAVLGASAAKFVMRMRPLLADGATYDVALELARS